MNIKDAIKSIEMKLAKSEPGEVPVEVFQKILSKNIKGEVPALKKEAAIPPMDKERVKNSIKMFMLGAKELPVERVDGKQWVADLVGKNRLEKGNVENELNHSSIAIKEPPAQKKNKDHVFTGLKNLIGKSEWIKSSLSGEKEDNDGKMFLKWNNGEIFKTEDVSGLKISDKYRKNTELNRIINREDWSPKERVIESNNMMNLQEVIGIKHNEFSSNSDNSDGMDVFQLSDIKNLYGKNLVKKITDYLVQNGIKNLDSLEVLVDHEDLGKFKIDARRVGLKGLIDLKIEVETLEGRDFFQKNESLLNKQLSSAGVKLQDLKIIDSKENILLNSFLLKQDGNQFVNLDNNVRDEDGYSQQERGDRNNQRRYLNDDEAMNKEEDND